MINALTVDVEEWFHGNALNVPHDRWDSFRSTVVPNTLKLLDLFDKYLVKATFFILGCVAQKHPSLVHEITRRGHEIGSHGMNHKLVSQLTLGEFSHDLQHSIHILEQTAQMKITYYRAPSWSISREKLGALEILEQQGITCDSSLQPFKTPLSGINGLPTDPYYPMLNGRKLGLIEFPPTVLNVSQRNTLPYAGGFYFRFFPYPFIYRQLKARNVTKPGLVYIHPWELEPKIPKWKAKPHKYFIHYHNLMNTEKKLDRLLRDFQFAPIGQVIDGNVYPERSIA